MKKYMDPLLKLKYDDLGAEATKLREEIAELRRQLAMGTTSNYKMLGLKRRRLARVLTLQNAGQLDTQIKESTKTSTKETK